MSIEDDKLFLYPGDAARGIEVDPEQDPELAEYIQLNGVAYDIHTYGNLFDQPPEEIFGRVPTDEEIQSWWERQQPDASEYEFMHDLEDETDDEVDPEVDERVAEPDTEVDEAILATGGIVSFVDYRDKTAALQTEDERNVA